MEAVVESVTEIPEAGICIHRVALHLSYTVELYSLTYSLIQKCSLHLQSTLKCTFT